jgi:hypothetical protein
MQGHVDCIVFNDDAVGGQQRHHLRRLVLVQLASSNLDGLLRPTVAQAWELIEEPRLGCARYDDGEDRGLPAVSLRWNERPGFVNVDVHCASAIKLEFSLSCTGKRTERRRPISRKTREVHSKAAHVRNRSLVNDRGFRYALLTRVVSSAVLVTYIGAPMSRCHAFIDLRAFSSNLLTHFEIWASACAPGRARLMFQFRRLNLCEARS